MFLLFFMNSPDHHSLHGDGEFGEAYKVRQVVTVISNLRGGKTCSDHLNVQKNISNASRLQN